MEKNLVWKITAVMILLIMILSETPAMMVDGGGYTKTLGESTFTWEDDFLDTSRIDSEWSYDYVVSNSNVTMDNTFEVWADPEWTRMKPIEVINTGGETFNHYLLDLTVYYDPDMQQDFDDLRFYNKSGVPLDYQRIEKVNGEYVDILVEIPEIQAESVETIYMFYGNPSASYGGVDDIFSWQEITGDDLRVSWTGNSEGSWDPDVGYGAERFLVAWEEGNGPEYDPEQWHRVEPRHIHGRIYDINGGSPIPSPPNDLHISTESSLYHSENPSIAYSPVSDKFFVVWEQNPTTGRWAVGIHGTMVRRSDGYCYAPFTVCNPEYQFPQYYPCFDPCVAYDEQSNRFFVVWAAADTNWNFDVYGMFYTPDGSPIGTKKTIASGSNYQGQPWICSDNNGHFMVVYEDGANAENGPFSIKSRLFDSDGNPVGSTQTLATGSSNVDHVFPSVSYNPRTEKYCVVWNTGDISNGDYNGQIKCRILSQNGEIETNIITIQSGIVYKIPDVTPYMGILFFVSYDDDYTDVNGIWGRLVSQDGSMISNRQELSDTNIYSPKEWNNVAVGNNNIFVAWEDKRLVSSPDEIYASIWTCSQSIGSPDVTYDFGDEEELVLEAVVVSTPIEPENLQEWDEFFADYTSDGGNIVFDVLDETATQVIRENISPGEDISDITESVIRLRATFTRNTPQSTPSLDKWGVTALVGDDIEPPWTTIELDPATPDGNNGWYISPVTITLMAYDNDTDPENITTYYRINNGDIVEYTGSFILSENGDNNSVEFWSIDSSGNEELPHNIIENIKIDTSEPFVNLLKPPDIVYTEHVEINGTASEYISGSGLEKIVIMINNEEIYNSSLHGFFTWFEWNLTIDYGETYDIHVKVYDQAGNIGHARKDVTRSEKGIYKTGYLYLFDLQPIPLEILDIMQLAVAINYDTLYVVLPETIDENTSSVKFVAKQILLGNEYSKWDNNVSDGCSCSFDIPFGLYEIKAYTYDDDGIETSNYLLISKILVILL